MPGADHQQFAEALVLLHGIDLTERAVGHTARRFASFGENSLLSVGDVERLNFQNENFDVFFRGMFYITALIRLRPFKNFGVF